MSNRVRNPEVYVKGYGKSITKDDLKKWFREFGKINCIQYKGPYSFIEFEDYYDAQYAVKEMNQKKIEGFRLIVEPSGKKKINTRSRSHSERRERHRRKSYSSSKSSSQYEIHNQAAHHLPIRNPSHRLYESGSFRTHSKGDPRINDSSRHQ